MFKEKSTKKRLVATESKEISTLDARHQNMILQLQQGIQNKKNLEETKDILITQLNYWKSIIEQLYLENNIQSKDYEIAWSSNIYYKDQLRLLNSQCKKIMDESKEIEYYENTGSILFDYYNLLENQTSIVSNKVQEEIFPKQMKGRKKFLPPNQKNILQAFNLEPESPPESICSLSGENPFQNKEIIEKIKKTKKIKFH